MPKTLVSRVEALEARSNDWVIVWQCPRCQQWIEGGRDAEGQPCDQHVLADGPADITLTWRGSLSTSVSGRSDGRG